VEQATIGEVSPLFPSSFENFGAIDTPSILSQQINPMISMGADEPL
jgi:hypothetical protein